MSTTAIFMFFSLFWKNRYLILLYAIAKILDQIVLPTLFKKLHKSSEDYHDSVPRATVCIFSILMVISIMANSANQMINWKKFPTDAGNPQESAEEPVPDEEEETALSPEEEILLEQTDPNDRVEKYILLSTVKTIPMDVWYSFTRSELYYVRNGIFAHEGRGFKEDELTGYFSRYQWYQGDIPPDDFAYSLLNAYQQENVRNIKMVEKSYRK